ncbi:MAG TPA: hypothetical protein DC024_00565 [Clostridiales bacterium]|jgi:CubicO group peptidase (beta-lactamase class C family)|nr:hypothetical protein [Clostridiales bacterium]
MNTNLSQRLERSINKMIASNQIHEAVVFVENTNGEFSFSKGYGGKGIDSPLLMASITKMLTTTCILILKEQGRLSLDDKIMKYFDNSVMEGLHVYKGKEYSFKLTLSDLLYQISGLPDIYEEGSNSYKNRLINEDCSYTLLESIGATQKLSPHFAPRTTKRAYYADINFDILGEIIEKITNQSLSNAYSHYIFEALGLKNTYLPESENDFVPVIYNGDEAIYRPKFVISSKGSGGCITTAREMMIFLKAFFGGGLFDISILNELSLFNKLQAAMWPICYGSGYMRIPLGGLTTFFKAKGELKGHSSSTGSFAFYYPNKDLYITGDLNQMKKPALPIKLSIQIAMMIKEKF